MQTLRQATLPLVLLGCAWAVPAAADQAAGSPGLEGLRRIHDPEARASLLLDLVENCPLAHCPHNPETLLEEAEAASELIEDPARRAALLLRLARLQRQRGGVQEADAALERALTAAQAREAAPSAELMLRLALALEQAGKPAEAAALWQEYGPSLGALPNQRPGFPFPERPLEGTAGLAAGGLFFTDSTAQVRVDLDLYKQWPRHDLQLDLLLAADYDDSRDRRADAIRPQMQQLFVARRHLDANVNLFFDQLTSLNTDTFSADNNDEDKSLLSTTLTGVGFNLGRGKDPRSFQELQLGVGARYRYDEIKFERVRDNVDPVLGIVYRSRQIPLWLGFWDQTLALVSPPGDLSDITMWSSTGLSFPLSTRWHWKHEFVVRYEQQRPGPDYPQLRFEFATGITYSF